MVCPPVCIHPSLPPAKWGHQRCQSARDHSGLIVMHAGLPPPLIERLFIMKHLCCFQVRCLSYSFRPTCLRGPNKHCTPPGKTTFSQLLRTCWLAFRAIVQTWFPSNNALTRYSSHYTERVIASTINKLRCVCIYMIHLKDLHTELRDFS